MFSYYRDELLYALQKGYRVLDVFYGYVFKEGELLKRFSTSLRLKKEEAKKCGDKTIEAIHKLNLNSVYGKFGQKEDIVDTYIYHREQDFQTKTREYASTHVVKQYQNIYGTAIGVLLISKKRRSLTP